MLRCPRITAVRSKGMIAAIALETARYAELVSQRCFASGLIIETCGTQGDVLKLLPPLTLDLQDLEAGFDLIEQAILDVASAE